MRLLSVKQTSNYSLPFFVIDESIVEERLKALKKTLSKHWSSSIIAYSCKTNYDLLQSSVLTQNDVWPEVVSEQELLLVSTTKSRSKKLIYNGPYKTPSSLHALKNQQAIIHCDNWVDLAVVAANASTKNAVGLRVNFHVPFLKTSRFGFGFESNEVYKAIEKLIVLNVPIESLHLHLGSDVAGVEPYAVAAKKMAELAEIVIKSYRQPLSYIDMGGGFVGRGNPPYGVKTWRTPSISTYVSAITKPLRTNKVLQKAKPTLIVEPGRYLVDDATSFVCKVLDVKNQRQQHIILCDGTITMIPSVYYRPPTIEVFDSTLEPRSSSRTNPTTLYGASCREDDVLYEGNLPNCEPGDYLVFYGMGAYNSSMGSEFIFQKPKTMFV